mgnify:CR=1 FL=1
MIIEIAITGKIILGSNSEIDTSVGTITIPGNHSNQIATININNVLEDLLNSRFQSDERYTEEYIRYRQNSGYGLEKIIYELK